jgi:hypothetical protein
MTLKSLLNQDITLATASGKDKYGRESYGSGVSYKARVQLTTKTRVINTNESVEIRAIVYIDGAVSVSKGDKITHNSIEYRVFGVITATDGAGNTHHTKLELVKWL